MSAVRSAVTVIWLVFWIYWLASAASAKPGTRSVRARPPGFLIAVVAIVALHLFPTGGLAVSSTALQVVGSILLVAGLGLAVWARVHLGRNWGMPMTRKDEPELVTSGPYRFVRHPIYSGILLAILGTSLATNLYWLLAFAVLGAYFTYSAKVEEGLMVSAFPGTYPGYIARTKMLIPFVL
jgi:protein-S-isoprenylcysteine O-methyltransferase Ste14